MSIRSPTDNKNPHYVSDDAVDDDEIINHRSRAYDDAESRIYEQKRQQILNERRVVENRLLDSSNAAVRALYETEQIGMSAADDLMRQSEQLKNVDRNLDDINNITKTTQKHLTALKSVFSGIKFYFGRSNCADNSSSQKASSPPEEQSPTALKKALQEVKSESVIARQNNHPTLRSRFDTSGFASSFDDDEVAVAGAAKPKSSSQIIEEKFNQNINELSSGMSRLKTLAEGLSTELDEQLDLISNIDIKIDRADQKIQFQTNQMNRLLKK